MKRRHSTRLPLAIFALLVLTLGAGSLLAAQDAKNGQGAKPAAVAKQEDKTIHLFSHNLRSEMKGNIRVTTVPNGSVTQGDATFAAEMILVESQNDVHTFTCTGSPVFTDTEARITGDRVVGQSTPRYAEFTGNVKMVATPKKKEKEGEIEGKLASEPTTVTCNSLGYDYGKKLALAKGNVVVVQKNRTIWANEGTYDQNTELITLVGNVRMKNIGDEELKEMNNAETVTASLQDDWIDVVAKEGEKVEFILDVKDEEQKPAGNK